MFEGGERYAAYLAHELRTPLATQRALLELALGDPRADAATWREIGEDVLTACEQQERLLEACLALARSHRGPQRYEPVDLAAIAGEALGEHDLRSLTNVLALEPAWTTGDSRLIGRLAANLVANAIQHNLSGGGLIEVATRTRSARAHLTVANTGPLVPASELRRLFQPFQRLALDPPDAEGVGLGLAIVQSIADAHDATVAARARPGGGLGIDVSFPARG
jgi:signal transduction histidine kinase